MLGDFKAAATLESIFQVHCGIPLYLCRLLLCFCCARRLMGLTTSLCWMLSLIFSTKVLIACCSSEAIEGFFSVESVRGKHQNTEKTWRGTEGFWDVDCCAMCSMSNSIWQMKRGERWEIKVEVKYHGRNQMEMGGNNGKHFGLEPMGACC